MKGKMTDEMLEDGGFLLPPELAEFLKQPYVEYVIKRNLAESKTIRYKVLSVLTRLDSTIGGFKHPRISALLGKIGARIRK